MRTGLVLFLSAAIYPVPAFAEADPIAVAHAFVEALRSGDAEAFQSRHTQDAMFFGGDVGIPLAGVEKAFSQPKYKACTLGPLILKPEKVAADLLLNQTPASMRDGAAGKVEGILSCPATTGGIRLTRMTFYVSGDRVAIFAIGD